MFAMHTDDTDFSMELQPFEILKYFSVTNAGLRICFPVQLKNKKPVFMGLFLVVRLQCL